jgi:hypothetical protein
VAQPAKSASLSMVPGHSTHPFPQIRRQTGELVRRAWVASAPTVGAQPPFMFPSMKLGRPTPARVAAQRGILAASTPSRLVEFPLKVSAPVLPPQLDVLLPRRSSSGSYGSGSWGRDKAEDHVWFEDRWMVASLGDE